MTVAETPIAAILRGQRTTGDGVHLVARHYRKGVRLHTHMHREAQLAQQKKKKSATSSMQQRSATQPPSRGRRDSNAGA